MTIAPPVPEHGLNTPTSGVEDEETTTRRRRMMVVLAGTSATITVFALILFFRLLVLLSELGGVASGRVTLAPWLVPSAAGREWFVIGIAIFCNVPYILMIALAMFFRDRDRLNQALQVRVVDPNNPFQESLLGRWEWARNAARESGWQVTAHAAVLGALAAIPVGFGLMRIVEVAVLRTRLRGLDVDGYVTPVVIVIGVATAFAMEFGGLLIRVSRNDFGVRALAEATTALVRVLLSIGVLLTAIETADLGRLGPAEASLIGVAVGLLGDRIVRLVFETTATVFGTAGNEFDDGLDSVQGLGASERERLRSEGISSVQALAYASIPKLFFATPYEFGRLCDWQDQALLLLRIGPRRAEAWRVNGVRGATGASGMMKLQVGSDPPRPFTTEDLSLATSLSGDATVAELAAWKGCTPVGTAEVAPAPGGSKAGP